MRRSTVLHLAKVAGISGSEAHLLSLLPRARASAAGTSASCMLHEDEPGAWEFADALRARGVPVDAIRSARRRRPGRVRAGRRRTSRASRPPILHTHLVHADVYGQLAGAVARRAAARQHEARLQRVPRGRRLRARATGRSPASRISTSRSRAGSPATSPRRRGLRRDDEFEIVHYGIAPGRRAEAVRRDEPRAALHRPADPDQGPRRAAARARRGAQRRCPELTLDLAGRGPLEPALKALAKRARARGRSALSRLRRRRSPTAIDDAAIVVVPSLGEGFGMVALEAMERARPVIAADDRRPRRARRRRRDRPRSSRPPTPSRSRPRS